MASKFFGVFFVYTAGGLPLTGSAASMSFLTCLQDDGTPVTPQPVIEEIGGGAYRFLPKFHNPRHGMVFVVSTGGNPAVVDGYLRPEDPLLDTMASLSASADFTKRVISRAPFNPDR